MRHIQDLISYPRCSTEATTDHQCMETRQEGLVCRLNEGDDEVTNDVGFISDIITQ